MAAQEADMQQLGYEFRDGKLMQVGKNKGFVFTTQEHYDALADAVLNHVSKLLELEAGLLPLWLPLGVEAGAGTCIHVSRDFEAAERLLLIIQGMGRVRPGVWGCALCMNKDLDQGSMLPHLRRALDSGYGVIVLNPNQRVDQHGQQVQGSESAERHIAYVWEHLVSARCKAEGVDVVAHSAGGHALLAFLGFASGSDGAAAAAGAAAPGSPSRQSGSLRPVALDASRRLRRIAFTDSYHSANQLGYLPAGIRALLKDGNRAVNYVPHPQKAGTPVDEWVSLGNRMRSKEKGCRCISAGTQDHASTNYASIDMMFEFFATEEGTAPAFASAESTGSAGAGAGQATGSKATSSSAGCFGCLFPRRRKSA